MVLLRSTHQQQGFGTEQRGIFLRLCGPFAFVFVCSPGQVSTSGVAEEDEAPDTSGAADDQAHSQHGAVRHLPAQPAHKEEAQDDLHPAHAVHQAVAQLAKAEVALRQRSHHGLGDFKKDVHEVSQLDKVIQPEVEEEILIRAETSTL